METSRIGQVVRAIIAGLTGARAAEGEVREVLAFLERVVGTVASGFAEVEPILRRVTAMDDAAITIHARELHDELASVTTRETYRMVDDLCGRLAVLRDASGSFNHVVAAIPNPAVWDDLFDQLQMKEGAVADEMQRSVGELIYYLGQWLLIGDAGATLDTIRNSANQALTSVRDKLAELQGLRRTLVAASGKAGFATLIGAEPPRVEALIQMNIDRSRQEFNVTAGRDAIVGGGNVTVGQTSGDMNLAPHFPALRQAVEALPVSDAAKEEAMDYLKVAEKQAKKETPDASLIAGNLKSAVETLKDAGAIVGAATALGQSLQPIAAALGVALATFF